MTPQDPREKYEDRLIDHALQEKLGGTTPPEQSDNNMSSRPSDQRPLAADAASSPNTEKSRFGFLVTAALLFGGIVMVLVLTGPRQTETADDSPRDGQLLQAYLQEQAMSPSEELTRDELAQQLRRRIGPGGVRDVGSAPADLLLDYAGRPDAGDFAFADEAITEQDDAIRDMEVAGGTVASYGGQTLPSPNYQLDDVQYFAPGPEFRLSREAEVLIDQLTTDASPSGGESAMRFDANASVNGIPVLEPASPLVTSVVPVVEDGWVGGRAIRFGEFPDELEQREDEAIPAAIEGRVTAMRNNFVELSLGSDDGLREGSVVDLGRDSTYLGRVVVRRTAADRAVGEIIPEFRRGEITRGTRVVVIRPAVVPEPPQEDELVAVEPAPAEPAKEPEPEPKKTWRRAEAVPNASRLVIGDKDELLPEGVQMSVRIDGFRARVLMDLYYYNDRSQQLEGNFKLRLPDEASLYYFAFGEMAFEYRPQDGDLASEFITPELVMSTGTSPADIARLRDQTWENVKEARLVPRVKAAHAYSETVRRQVDPALVEWSGAGVFNARVFPLTPDKLHRIVVGYDVNLAHDGEDLLYQLDLPPDMATAIVDINIAESAVENCVIQPPLSDSVRPVTADGRTNFHFEDPQESITVRVDKPGTVLLTGNDEATGDFFATEFVADLPKADGRDPASHGVFLLDTSLSSNPERFNTYLSLLKALLDENRETMTQFAVLQFNVESHWWQESFVANTPENTKQLLDDCHTLVLEGATDLRSAFRTAASPAWLDDSEFPAVEFFLLSDGAATWGETNLHRVGGGLTKDALLRGPLFAYKTGQTGTASGVLEHLTRETGGAVFSVAKVEEIKQAATAHRQRPWQLLSMAVDGGNDLLIAGRPKTIYPDQSLQLVGRGRPTSEAKVVLSLQRGEEKKTLDIPFAKRIESELTPRLYGQVSVGQLEDLMHATEDVAVSYARHFRITGRTCSLLMLDSEEDYEQFHIKPEEDPFVIKSSPAAALVAKTLAEIGERLDDPKATLLHFLSQLEDFPGLEFKVPKALAIAIEGMPDSAFEIEVPALECHQRTTDGIPQDALKALQEKDLDYDVLVEEANRRLKEHGGADALKALSSLIENSPGDVVMARDVAFSAMEWKMSGHAVPLLKRVANMRPYEPQTYQALGKSLAAIGEVDQAIIYYEILMGAKWHDRYGEMRKIAAVEYLDLLRRVSAGELMTSVPDFAKARLETLSKNTNIVGSDIVITMMWNTDRTDVDLHVIEPSGEKCYYEQTETKSGGYITDDVTTGFGPEMYVNKEAPTGDYQVLADFYGSDANRTSARTKVFVTLYKHFGTQRQQVMTHVVPLAREKETRPVATVALD